MRPAATVLGMGSASVAQPTVGTACGCGSGHAERGTASPGSPTDKVSWGRRFEHRGGSGSTPNMVAAVGVHPIDESTMRGKKGGGSSTFQGGGGVRWPGRVARGPAARGGDGGGEGPPDRGERSVQIELTVEGENGGGGGLKYGEGQRRFGHRRGPEAEGRGGVLMVSFKGRTEGGEKGRGSVRRHPFKWRSGGIGKRGGVRTQCLRGGGRRKERGGLAW
jgi:hypothetical protein